MQRNGFEGWQRKIAWAAMTGVVVGGATWLTYLDDVRDKWLRPEDVAVLTKQAAEAADGVERRVLS